MKASSSQQKLDYDHLREKQKGKANLLIDHLDLQEKERAFAEQKELQRQLKADIEERKK